MIQTVIVLPLPSVESVPWEDEPDDDEEEQAAAERTVASAAAAAILRFKTSS
jgi:hypothetical protein